MADEKLVGGKCPASDVKKWGKFLAGILIVVAPQIPGLGPIIAANPELAVSLTGGLVALLTGEAPMAATKRVAARMKKKPGGPVV